MLLCGTNNGWCDTSTTVSGNNTGTKQPTAQPAANPFEVTTEQEHVDTGENQFGSQLKTYFESLDCQNELLADYSAYNRLSNLQSRDIELFARQKQL